MANKIKSLSSKSSWLRASRGCGTHNDKEVGWVSWEQGRRISYPGWGREGFLEEMMYRLSQWKMLSLGKTGVKDIPDRSSHLNKVIRKVITSGSFVKEQFGDVIYHVTL